MQLSTKTHHMIKVTLVIGFALYSLTACKGIGHSIGGASDDVGRTAAKAGTKTTSPKIPAAHINSGTQKTYKVVDVRQSADELIASLDTANGLYNIYVDCRTGVITRGQVSPTEQVNVVRDVCNFVSGSADSNSTTSQPSTNNKFSDAAAKERAWQKYYQSCGGDYQRFEANFREVFEKSWRETGDRPRGCG